MASHEEGYHEDGDDTYDGQYNDWAEVSGSDGDYDADDGFVSTDEERASYSDDDHHDFRDREDVDDESSSDHGPPSSLPLSDFTSQALNAADALQSSYDDSLKEIAALMAALVAPSTRTGHGAPSSAGLQASSRIPRLASRSSLGSRSRSMGPGDRNANPRASPSGSDRSSDAAVLPLGGRRGRIRASSSGSGRHDSSSGPDAASRARPGSFSEASSDAIVVHKGRRRNADGLTVEEKLIRSRVEREERLEVLRQEKAAAELKQLRPGPVINETSRRLAAKASGGKTITDRMATLEQARLSKQEELRKAVQEKELEHVRDKPEINKASRKMQRSVSSMMSWQKKRDEKLAAARLEKETRESQALRAKPKISKGSAAIISEMKRKKRLEEELSEASSTATSSSKTDVLRIEEDDVGERLYSRAAVYTRRKEILSKKVASEHSHKPQLSAHSANYVREGGASERLYRLGAVRAKDRAEAAQRKAAIEARFDPATGRELFKPRINKRSAALAARKKGPSAGGASASASSSASGPSSAKGPASTAATPPVPPSLPPSAGDASGIPAPEPATVGGLGSPFRAQRVSARSRPAPPPIGLVAALVPSGASDDDGVPAEEVEPSVSSVRNAVGSGASVGMTSAGATFSGFPSPQALSQTPTGEPLPMSPSSVMLSSALNQATSFLREQLGERHSPTGRIQDAEILSAKPGSGGVLLSSALPPPLPRSNGSSASVPLSTASNRASDLTPPSIAGAASAPLPPSDDEAAAAFEAAKLYLGLARSTDIASPPVEPFGPDASLVTPESLPEGWERGVTKDGVEYFYNEATEEICFPHDPEPVKLSPSPRRRRRRRDPGQSGGDGRRRDGAGGRGGEKPRRSGRREGDRHRPPRASRDPSSGSAGARPLASSAIPGLSTSLPSEGRMGPPPPPTPPPPSRTEVCRPRNDSGSDPDSWVEAEGRKFLERYRLRALGGM